MAKKKPKIPSYNGFYVEKYHAPQEGGISKLLMDFLTHWYYRAENYRYYRHEDMSRKGLCQALVVYFNDYETDEHMFSIDEYVNELRAMFEEDGLDRAFPFNDGIEGFLKEEDCTQNQKRKDWVKSRLQREQMRVLGKTDYR